MTSGNYCSCKTLVTFSKRISNRARVNRFRNERITCIAPALALFLDSRFPTVGAVSTFFFPPFPLFFFFPPFLQATGRRLAGTASRRLRFEFSNPYNSPYTPFVPFTPPARRGAQQTACDMFSRIPPPATPCSHPHPVHRPFDETYRPPYMWQTYWSFRAPPLLSFAPFSSLFLRICFGSR